VLSERAVSQRGPLLPDGLAAMENCFRTNQVKLFIANKMSAFILGRFVFDNGKGNPYKQLTFNTSCSWAKLV